LIIFDENISVIIHGLISDTLDPKKEKSKEKQLINMMNRRELISLKMLID
jgi:hypothetical protein